MAIKHKKTSTKPANSDAAEVQPFDWNDDHAVDGLLGALMGLGLRGNAFPYLDGTSTAQLADLTALARTLLAISTAPAFLAALAGAALDSPNLIGTPTAPTPMLGTATPQIATMAALQAMRDDLVNAAPGALDTLRELATALGNDPNFAATTAAALGMRLRVDAAQGLTAPQKAQAIANLSLALVAVSGAYADLTGLPTLGTAAALNFGTGANQLVRLDGSSRLPAVDGSQLTNLPAASPSQSGRFVCLSTTQVQFQPYNGGIVWISGAPYAVPAAGVTGGLTGVYVNGVAGQNLAPSTVYYAYLFNNAGTLTLDFSTTGHGRSSTAGNVGREIKIGDDSRTLVGMVYVDGTTHFVTDPGLTLSWFNRRSFVNPSVAGSNASTTSATTINTGPSAIVQLLCWGDEPINATLTAAVKTSGAWCQFGVGVDGAPGAAASLIGSAPITYQTTFHTAAMAGGFAQLSEGLHAFWPALGAIPGGTAEMLNVTMNLSTRG